MHTDGFHVSFLFSDRSLLVLDDIWDSWVLKAFDSHFQVLITSRDRSVTDSVTGKDWFLSCFCALILNFRV